MKRTIDRLVIVALLVVALAGVQVLTAEAGTPGYTPLEQRIRSVANSDADTIVEGLRAGRATLDEEQDRSFMVEFQRVLFPHDVGKDEDDGHSEQRRKLLELLKKDTENGQEVFDLITNTVSWKGEDNE